MRPTAGVIDALRELLAPASAAPVLGRVVAIHEGPGKGAYSVDVRVVRPGTLEETDQVIAEVPISPIWAGRGGRGIYAIPPKDAVVVVGFVEWDAAFPFVVSVWADEYEAGEFAQDQLVVTDGAGTTFGIDVDSLFRFETGAQSLKGILNALIDEIAALQTQGPPPSHFVSPISVQKLLALKTEIAKLVK